jgi:NitT/TauT family transport system substrate-binding protein
MFQRGSEGMRRKGGIIMKKIIAVLLCCLLMVATLAACQSESNGGGADVPIKVMLVDGAPLLSMAYMMSDEAAGIDGYDISYTMTNDSDALVAALLNQDPDFAIAPINVAAMMNNNGSGYRLAAVTIWGIMQIVSDQDVTTLADLRDETIVAFGRSGTPGITLRAVLEQNNIPYNEPETANFMTNPDQVSIVYLTAPSDVRDALATGMEVGGKPASFGLLAEPVATAITGFASNAGRPGFTAKINLQDEWAKNNNGESYPQAALIFHERLLTENAGFVADFIAAAEQSSVYANENPIEAGDLAVSLGSVTIPNGTVVGNAYNAGRLPLNFTYASAAKQAVNAYLEVFLEENASLIGGKMPVDSFYYE